MPIKQASIKDLRKSKKRTTRNEGVRRQMAHLVKTLEGLIAEKKVPDVSAAFVAVTKQIDKAAKVGILHGNTAARIKSRLAKRINALKK